MSSKISKTFRFSPLTIQLLELIAEKEQRNLTNALEFLIKEKAEKYKQEKKIK